MRRLGVLTSGGDAPGMNAAIRAVVRTACSMKLEVLGIERGYQGLVEGQFRPMDVRSVSSINHLGGTVLRTARCDAFLTEEGRASAAANLQRAEIDGLVVIGGDGTYRGAVALSQEHGLAIIGVPGTIDNDIPGTFATIGFDTAVNTALDCIDRVRDTSEAHEKVAIVEVMGRRAGFIALASGLAGGAEAVLVPERRVDWEALAQSVCAWQARGKKSCIIVVAEGAASAEEVAAAIETRTGVRSRVTILGYIQRGGRPTARDRILATRFGYHAVRLLQEGRSALMVGLGNADEITPTPLSRILEDKKGIDEELLDVLGVTAS